MAKGVRKNNLITMTLFHERGSGGGGGGGGEAQGHLYQPRAYRLYEKRACN